MCVIVDSRQIVFRRRVVERESEADLIMRRSLVLGLLRKRNDERAGQGSRQLILRLGFLGESNLLSCLDFSCVGLGDFVGEERKGAQLMGFRPCSAKNEVVQNSPFAGTGAFLEVFRRFDYLRAWASCINL